MNILIPTEEQIQEKLSRFDKNDSFLVVPDSIDEENPGFIHPDDIVQYYCAECRNTFDGAPSGIEVYIHDDSDIIDKQPIRAHVSYSHMVETEKEKQTHHLCMFSIPIAKLGDIPVEFIEYDGTGDYKTPTPEAIEDVFKYAEGIAAQQGKFTSSPFNARPCVAQENLIRRWTGKIGYEISEARLSSFKTIYKVSFILAYQDNLEERLDNLWSYVSRDHEIAPVLIEALVDVLPYLKMPDFKTEKRIAEILFSDYRVKIIKREELERQKQQLESRLDEALAKEHGARISCLEGIKRAGLPDIIRKSLPIG